FSIESSHFSPGSDFSCAYAAPHSASVAITASVLRMSTSECRSGGCVSPRAGRFARYDEFVIRTIALGLLPPLAVFATAHLGIERLWAVVGTYHAICVIVPLASRLRAADAGLTRSGGRRWLIASVVVSIVVGAGIFFIGRLPFARAQFPAES